MKINHLSISWATSRGRDTYGYNICRLDSRASGARYRTCGGGYDMIGTIFGDFLAAEHQDALRQLAAASVPYAQTSHRCHPELYGLFFRADGSAYCDGASGIESMRRIAEAIGLEVQWECNKRGRTVGYFVCPREEVTA